MNADLRNFLWELCLLPHKVKNEHKDKFQSCLLGLEDMTPDEFWRIFDLRPGMQKHKCTTCKWYMNGKCCHPFMPMKMISGIFSECLGVNIFNQLLKVTNNPSITDDQIKYQEVDRDNVCNEWTDPNILDLGYRGVASFIDNLLDDNLGSLVYGKDETLFWNSINYYINKGFGDQDSEECREFFKNWMFEVKDEFLKIYKEEYDYTKHEEHDKKVAKYKEELKFELFTFWLRRPDFHDPLERYMK